MLAAAFLASASWLPRPPLAPTRGASLARPAAASRVRLCAADEPPLVGGEPVKVDDFLLCRDEASNAWWRASVKEIRGSDLLIHWSGCGDEWDEWRAAASPDIIREEARPAFQSEEYEESLDDQEVLAQMREKKWAENARWQLNVFAQAQLGEWAGEATMYEVAAWDPSDAESKLRLRKADTRPCSAAGAIIDGANLVRWSDQLGEPGLEREVELGDAEFYPQVGNMAVGNAFTLVGGGSDDGSLLVELGLRDTTKRVRCKLEYARDAGGGGGGEVVRLSRVAVLRERDAALPAPPPPSDDSRARPGTGLYDPPPGDKGSYCTLYCDEGVTLVCPSTLPLDASKGVISLDWTGETMRYQVDRKFARLDGSLSSFELTEIQSEDSGNYPPNFKRN